MRAREDSHALILSSGQLLEADDERGADRAWRTEVDERRAGACECIKATAERPDIEFVEQVADVDLKIAMLESCAGQRIADVEIDHRVTLELGTGEDQLAIPIAVDGGLDDAVDVVQEARAGALRLDTQRQIAQIAFDAATEEIFGRSAFTLSAGTKIGNSTLHIAETGELDVAVRRAAPGYGVVLNLRLDV